MNVASKGFFWGISLMVFSASHVRSRERMRDLDNFWQYVQVFQNENMSFSSLGSCFFLPLVAYPCLVSYFSHMHTCNRHSVSLELVACISQQQVDQK